MSTIYKVLKNNIKIFSAQNSYLHSINIGFYFKVGSVYESYHNNGISHLCEHMFFRRLNNFPQNSLYFNMEKIGTTMMAKTYSDFMCFDMTVSSKYFNEAIDIIIQLLYDFDWKNEELIAEKAVVKKQIEFKSYTFSDFVNDTYFKGTKLKMPIMGTEKSVDKITINQVNAWKRKFFNTNNLFCVLTGGFSNCNLIDLEKALENIRKTSYYAPYPPTIMPQNFCCRTNNDDMIINTDWDIAEVSITFDIDTSQVNECISDIISSILGEGVGSRLSLSLREKLAFTDEVCSKIDTFLSFRRLSISFATNNIDLLNSLEACLAEIISFKNNVTKVDLDSSLVFFTDNQKFILDSPRDYNFYLGWNTFVLNNYADINKKIQNYKNIVLEDLLQAIQKIFVSSNCVISLTNNPKFCKKGNLKKTIENFRKLLGQSSDRSKPQQKTGDG